PPPHPDLPPFPTRRSSDLRRSWRRWNCTMRSAPPMKMATNIPPRTSAPGFRAMLRRQRSIVLRFLFHRPLLPCRMYPVATLSLHICFPLIFRPRSSCFFHVSPGNQSHAEASPPTFRGHAWGFLWVLDRRGRIAAGASAYG